VRAGPPPRTRRDLRRHNLTTSLHLGALAGRWRRIALAALLAVAAAVGALVWSARHQPPLFPLPPPACGRLAGAEAPATVHHVVLIVMENRDGADAVRPKDAPFTAALAAGCPSTTASLAATHPSFPNYLELTAGTHAQVASDCAPAAHACSSIHGVPSIFGRVDWRTYAESMGSPCDRGGQSRLSMLLAALNLVPGRYAVKHNPAAYFDDAAAQCERRDLPLGDYREGALIDAVRHDRLPALTLIVPNLCHDTHDCSLATGDRFLATWVPRLARTPAYRRGELVVFVTWDEGRERGRAGETGHGERCRRADPSCLVALIAVSAWSRHVDLRGASHDVLLRTVAELTGVPARGLGRAASAASLRDAVLGR
jgi:phosphatidylinositol-3-phosphatase